RAGRRPRPWHPARHGSRLGVLYRHPLLVAVIAAGGTHPMRALQIAAPRAGLQRDGCRLVMGAAGALLPLGSPSLGYGHGIVLFQSRSLWFRAVSPLRRWSVAVWQPQGA